MEAAHKISIKELIDYHSKLLDYYQNQLNILIDLDVDSYENLRQRALIREDTAKFRTKVTYTLALLEYLDYLERLETYGDS